jgi:hypothetical protein
MRAGAIAQPPLTSGTVGGLDAHRGIDGKATAVFPLAHRPRVIAWQQATARRRTTAAGAPSYPQKQLLLCPSTP